MHRGYWRVAGDFGINDPWQLYDEEEDSLEYDTVIRPQKSKTKSKRKITRPKIINIIMKPTVPSDTTGIPLPQVTDSDFAQYNNAIVNVSNNTNARNRNFAEGLRPLGANCIADHAVSSLFQQYLKLTNLRSIPRYATTPSSTHPSIELFTSRSPDTTPKLYPGDDPITLGEGRRSGADASSHSRSTRSITDRNCNTKGLQESQCYHNALLSPTTANNQFKPIGARSELLNSHLHNNNNHFNATLNSEYGCGVDGLVAMGNHTMTMPRNGRCLYVNGLSSALQTSGAQYTVSMRKANKSSNMGTPGSSVKQAAGKEAEPKYTDPFQGAPHDFQQRIAELALLEADTIRNERYRKAKRKTRMDKDS